MKNAVVRFGNITIVGLKAISRNKKIGRAHV